MWQNLVDNIAKLFDVPATLIMRVHPPSIEVFVASNSPGNPYEKGEQADLPGLYCNTVMESQQPLLIPNARKDPNWNQNPDIKLGMISYLGYPLNWPNGDTFGTICVLDSKENEYSEKFIDILHQFKLMVESHLDLIQVNQRLEEKNKMLEKALKEIKSLKRLLPICSICKRIRNDEGYWAEVDQYLHQYSEFEFSHGLCDNCFREKYPEEADQILKEIEAERKEKKQ
jgi:transcriptional regulator with GAF, ATPase, and Fis domain